LGFDLVCRTGKELYERTTETTENSMDDFTKRHVPVPGNYIDTGRCGQASGQAIRQGEGGIIMEQCKGCQRLMKNGECAALKPKPENCWAYTTDPDWAKKVREQVDIYKGLKKYKGD